MYLFFVECAEMGVGKIIARNFGHAETKFKEIYGEGLTPDRITLIAGEDALIKAYGDRGAKSTSPIHLGGISDS